MKHSIFTVGACLLIAAVAASQDPLPQRNVLPSNEQRSLAPAEQPGRPNVLPDRPAIRGMINDQAPQVRPPFPAIPLRVAVEASNAARAELNPIRLPADHANLKSPAPVDRALAVQAADDKVNKLTGNTEARGLLVNPNAARAPIAPEALPNNRNAPAKPR